MGDAYPSIDWAGSIINFTSGSRFVVRASLLSLLMGCITLVEGCVGTAPGRDLEGVLRGNVTYLRRTPLPPDADLVVQLRQLSAPGEPPRLVVERRIESPGQIPIAFELRYDRRTIDVTRRHELAALVLRGEQTLLMSGSAYPVLSGRYPDQVEVVLHPSR